MGGGFLFIIKFKEVFNNSNKMIKLIITIT